MLERPRVHERPHKFVANPRTQEACVLPDHDPFSLLLPRKGYISRREPHIGRERPKFTARKRGRSVSKEERREDKVEFASQPDAITNTTGSTGPVSHRLEQQLSRRGGDRPR